MRISHSATVDTWRERERSLRRLGVDVSLLTARAWDTGGSQVRLSAREGEPVTGVRTWGRHPALFVYDPRPVWRALGERPDLVDLHEEPFALSTAEVLLLRRLRRLRAPYTLYSAQNIDKRYPPPFRWLERAALRSAAGISVCNAEAGRIVRRKGLPGVPSVIPLGIDTAHFRPDPGPRERDVGDPVVVGYVGRLARHKGVDVLLDAVAADDRLVLRLAGGGPSEAELRARAGELGLEARVRFEGALSQEELPAFYRGLDVLAVPSLTTTGWVEQFGRVAVEAMACGVPVVASDSGALPDVVAGAGELVRPGDPVALRAALLRLGTDPEAAAVARKQGLARAQECSWERVAAQYLAMYERAVHLPLASQDGRRVEVVVVAYGAPELLRRALSPVRTMPVTVVDNSSSSRVRSVCAELGVRYLDPGRNGGFAAGVNHGLRNRLLPGADVLLLNPDAVVEPEAIARLQEALHADPGLASVGPAQVDEAGRPSRVEWPFPSPHRAWLEALGLRRLPSRSTYVIGSVLLLRAEALAQVGELDEDFFLYAEETDWAYRAAHLGWRHALVDGVSAVHAGGATSADGAARELRFHAAQERYLRKHFGAFGWQLTRLARVAGAAARVVARPARRDLDKRMLALYLRGPLRRQESVAPRPDPAAAGSAP